MRTIDDLVQHSEPAWELVAKAVARSPHPVEVLPRTLERAERTLLGLQVTTRTTIGAVAFYTGGLLVDGGWLRILGSGHDRFGRDVLAWNRPGSAAPRLAQAMLVADDVVGGFFALNGGALPGELHQVHYLDPRTRYWLDLGCGYSEFLSWACSDAVADFYADVRGRWPRWREETADVAADRALVLDPPLSEGLAPTGERRKTAVSIDEVWTLHHGTDADCR